MTSSATASSSNRAPPTIWRWAIWRSVPGQTSTGYLIAGFLVLALTLFQGWFGGEMVYSQGAGVAAAGQGTEPAPEAQRRLAKVKEILAPGEAHVGAPGKGIEREQGQGEKNRPATTPESH